MKIVARGTLHQGKVGSDRAVATFPMVLGLKDGRVLATCKAGAECSPSRPWRFVHNRLKKSRTSAKAG